MITNAIKTTKEAVRNAAGEATKDAAEEFKTAAEKVKITAENAAGNVTKTATSALMAWLFLDENLTNLDLLGFLITTVGVYIATRD